MRVIQELVTHHVQEEENEYFPRAKDKISDRQAREMAPQFEEYKRVPPAERSHEL